MVVFEGKKTGKHVSQHATKLILEGKKSIREISPKEPLKRKKIVKRFRGDYFKYYREERQLLRILSAGTKVSIGRKWETYYRKVYYKVIPILCYRLGWGPDRELLAETEFVWWTILNSGRRQAGKGQAERLSYDVRTFTGYEKSLMARVKHATACEGKSSIEPLDLSESGDISVPW